MQAIGDLDSERHQAWEAFLTAYRAKLKEEGLSTPERQASMNAINPLYIPRNQVLQEVIKSAEAGDYGPVCPLLLPESEHGDLPHTSRQLQYLVRGSVGMIWGPSPAQAALQAGFCSICACPA